MSETDIKNLITKVQGSVITSKDADYPLLIQRWALNAQRNPAVIVLPITNSDVAAAVPIKSTILI